MCRMFLVGILVLASFCIYAGPVCHPVPNPTAKNYIIGYGSLMEKQSRQRTNPNAHNVYPIKLLGYQREWGIHGGHYKTTFLTLIENKKKWLNAVYYQASKDDIVAADRREKGYCRREVSSKDIVPLGLAAVPSGSFWVYAQKGTKVQLPSNIYPVVQSYVDIFMNGCFEIQDAYQLQNFARDCVATTSGWPTTAILPTWINDRLYPRRPFDVPNVVRIDRLLSSKLDRYYQHPIS